MGNCSSTEANVVREKNRKMRLRMKERANFVKRVMSGEATQEELRSQNNSSSTRSQTRSQLSDLSELIEVETELSREIADADVQDTTANDAVLPDVPQVLSTTSSQCPSNYRFEEEYSAGSTPSSQSLERKKYDDAHSIGVNFSEDAGEAEVISDSDSTTFLSAKHPHHSRVNSIGVSFSDLHRHITDRRMDRERESSAVPRAPESPKCDLTLAVGATTTSPQHRQPETTPEYEREPSFAASVPHSFPSTNSIEVHFGHNPLKGRTSPDPFPELFRRSGCTTPCGSEKVSPQVQLESWSAPLSPSSCDNAVALSPFSVAHFPTSPTTVPASSHPTSPVRPLHQTKASENLRLQLNSTIAYYEHFARTATP